MNTHSIKQGLPALFAATICMMLAFTVAPTLAVAAESDPGISESSSAGLVDAAEAAVGLPVDAADLEIVDSGLVAETEQGEVSFPGESGGDFTLSSNDVEVSFGLPNQVVADEAKVEDGSSVVYADDAGGVDVIATADQGGSLVIRTVIAGPDSAHSFTYSLDPQTVPVLEDDGSVTLTQVDQEGIQQIVGMINTPWAVDVDGNPVETYYDVVGSEVTQIVAVSEATAYTVVADPSVSVAWWGAYVKFNRSETKTIAGKSNWISASSAICAAVPNVPAAVACGVLSSLQKDSIIGTFRNAVRNSQCVQLKFLRVGVQPVLVGWSGVKC